MAEITYSGTKFDFDAAVTLMDDDLREELHSAVGSNDTTEQEFFNMYAAAHEARFGVPFVVN